MKQLIWSEWERVWARKKTKIWLVLYPILVVLSILFMKTFGRGIGFYDPLHAVPINSLNFAPFLLKEVSFYLVLIILPMLFIDSLNGEHTSGAYRLVLIRPYQRWQLLSAKWVIQALISLVLLLITLVMGFIAGVLFFPSAEMVTFFQSTTVLTGGQVLVYMLAFYGFIWCIHLAILGIISVLSSILPNAILVYCGFLGLAFGMLYVNDAFQFLLLHGETAFRVLSPLGVPGVLWLTPLLILGGFIMSLWIWSKRDWSL